MESVSGSPASLGEPAKQVDGTQDHTKANQSRPRWLARLPRFWRRSQPVSTPQLPEETPPAKSTLTAFVLLGGGSRGAAQAGALAVALERGIRPDVLIGVSAGAWNGAYLAADPTPERTRSLCDLWAKTKNTDLLGGGWWQAAVSAVSGRPALYSAAGPLRVAHRYLEKHTFEELKVPLHILAANLTTGQPKLFSSGRILPAMLASSAVPGIFPPVVKDGQVYVDGGLLEWDASAAALALGAQRVYLFGCGAIGEISPRLILASEQSGAENGARPKKKSQLRASELPEESQAPGTALGANLLDVLERSWDVISQYQFQRTVEGLRRGGAQVTSIQPILPKLSRPLDFNRSAGMIAAGRAAAEAVLDAEVSALLGVNLSSSVVSR